VTTQGNPPDQVGQIPERQRELIERDAGVAQGG
jgi:hypothetical protein